MLIDSQNKVNAIRDVCSALLEGNESRARTIASRDYPFTPVPKTRAKWSARDSLRIFVRDGFIDRYSGDLLVFPGMLRVISTLLPEASPYHPHGKLSECHIAHWELYPTVDHMTPLSRGGKDDEGNRVTTSMLRNMAKSNWTLEELGWELLPPGDYGKWDGLTEEFIRLVEKHGELLDKVQIRLWHSAAMEAVRS
jgi:hypothetical protein